MRVVPTLTFQISSFSIEEEYTVTVVPSNTFGSGMPASANFLSMIMCIHIATMYVMLVSYLFNTEPKKAWSMIIVIKSVYLVMNIFVNLARVRALSVREELGGEVVLWSQTMYMYQRDIWFCETKGGVGCGKWVFASPDDYYKGG